MNHNFLTSADFKNFVSSRKGSRHYFPLILAAAAATVLIGITILSTILAHSNQSTPTGLNISNSTTKELSLLLAPSADHSLTQTTGIVENPFKAVTQPAPVENSGTTPQATDKKDKRVTVVVEKGDTFSSILSDLDIHSELTRVLNLDKQANPLKRIYPGQKLHFSFDDMGLDFIELEKSITESLFLRRNDEVFIVEKSTRELDKFTQVAAGIINNSLFLAGQNAGMSDKLIMSLAQIFGWDIDFALDIRGGDSFTILYEELYLDGEKVGDGNIIAAEFVNNKNTYRAYRYTDSNGKTEYYSPDGKSMRKPFLRTPVNLARISSYFNLRRRHPILNKIRAHKGVDYAASTGTPIMASGDGKVVYRGNKGGYGKTIILQHNYTYTTLYAHMLKYARGTGVGSRVRQGQTIGYIGQTGLATGPHLHYEFRVNNVHRNPLKVKLPSAKPLPDSEKERFQAAIQPLLVQLDAYTKNTQNALVMRDL